MATFVLRHLGRAEESIEITADTTVIGRRPGSGIVIDDSVVSRDHAEVVRTPSGAYRLRDLGSSNGTWVNGVQLGEATWVCRTAMSSRSATST